MVFQSVATGSTHYNWWMGCELRNGEATFKRCIWEGGVTQKTSNSLQVTITQQGSFTFLLIDE
jgi:hypothetical protein